MVGDWMASMYDACGRRWDYHLFLDNDGRFERSVRRESEYEQRDTGRWEYDEGERVLRLASDMPDDSDRMSSSWRVLSVATCEDSNTLLVLREIILASRNLPLLFYRVHSGGRAYGTERQRNAFPGIF
jgi:hypothetical protein